MADNEERTRTGGSKDRRARQKGRVREAKSAGSRVRMQQKAPTSSFGSSAPWSWSWSSRVLIYHFTVGQYHVKTKDAYVNGNLIRLPPQVSGTVTEITTDQTQPVTRGQMLVRLDSHDTDISLAQAKANLAQTVRDVAQLFAQEQRDEAAVCAAGATDVANQNLARDQGLVGALVYHRRIWSATRKTTATPKPASDKPARHWTERAPFPALSPKPTRECCKPRPTCARPGWRGIAPVCALSPDMWCAGVRATRSAGHSGH